MGIFFDSIKYAISFVISFSTYNLFSKLHKFSNGTFWMFLLIWKINFLICLNDEFNLTYKVAEITYIERDDESFEYEIKPNYSVIGLLDSKDFQGIPGLDIDLKKRSYVRKNVIPVFISERAPAKNREDLLKNAPLLSQKK